MTATVEQAGKATLTFHTGDCVAGMEEQLAAGSVDLVVTSPPYNLGIAYGRYQDTLPRAEYLAWIGRWAAAVRRVLAPRGSLFLNVGGKPSDPWIPFDVAGAVRGSLQLQNTLHWVKSIAIDRDSVGKGSDPGADLVVGHFKPIQSERFVNDCHEYIFHFTPAGETPLDRLGIGVPYQDKSNVTRWKAAASDRRCRGNAWFLPYETITRRDRDRPHPASFPAALPERCIRLHGLERTRLVLDPFSGIGNTALACARLGVDFVGYEIDPEYQQEAIRRVREELAGPRQGRLPSGA